MTREAILKDLANSRLMLQDGIRNYPHDPVRVAGNLIGLIAIVEKIVEVVFQKPSHEE